MTMIEKVARAIWKHERDTLQHAEPFVLSRYEGKVRAALQALREPTPDMLDATDFVNGVDEYPRALWQDMIDAALGE